MIGARFGHVSDSLLRGVSQKIRINPNVLTIFGFLITGAAGITLSFNPFWGGVLILLGGFFDMLDGAVARANNRVTRFGAFLDSVLDRYADAFLFLGTTFYFKESPTEAALSLGCMVGAFLISYARARAEGLGIQCKAGLMERPERIVFLAFGALTGWLSGVLWAMLILTHFTVLQRVYNVRKTILKGERYG